MPQAVAEVIGVSRGADRGRSRGEHLRHAAEFLQAEPGLRFDFLSDISAVDRFPIEPRFELNYHLLSIPGAQTMRLRVRLPGERSGGRRWSAGLADGELARARDFDLFGIRFEGHPDLRRMLMPDDWEGYPLRKDYPVEGFR